MKHRPRAHPAGRGLTYAASPGHEQYDLAPLPGDFCWTYGELAAPGLTAQAMIDAAELVRREEQ